MEKIVKCGNCEREINLNTDAQTCCPGCQKDFCFSMSSTCFCDYHYKNNLREGHSAQSICDPTWKVNIRYSNE